MSRKNILVFFCMLALGGVIFWWSFRDVSWAQFASSIAGAHWGWLILALVAMMFICYWKQLWSRFCG
ncbi:Uncharacterised protein [Weissella viridescens]|uniref:Uncharacterized protein n=1 Tax=Weissella viridescens TaxID=1629 RepID=A0A380NVV1_WEIVI|nr:Uncharacterised protein [Weissella viridescens]